LSWLQIVERFRTRSNEAAEVLFHLTSTARNFSERLKTLSSFYNNTITINVPMLPTSSNTYNGDKNIPVQSDEARRRVRPHYLERDLYRVVQRHVAAYTNSMELNAHSGDLVGIIKQNDPNPRISSVHDGLTHEFLPKKLLVPITSSNNSSLICHTPLIPLCTDLISSSSASLPLTSELSKNHFVNPALNFNQASPLQNANNKLQRSDTEPIQSLINSTLDSLPSPRQESIYLNEPNVVDQLPAIFYEQHQYASIDFEDSFESPQPLSSSSDKQNPSESNENQNSHTQIYVALYDFQYESKGVLSLNIGDRMLVLRTVDDGGNKDWWYVEILNGEKRRGYVPANYIQPTILLVTFVLLKMIYGFHYVHDVLYIDNTTVTDIIQHISEKIHDGTVPTPFFLYSMKQFYLNVGKFQNALLELAPMRSHLSYSMKANFNPFLIRKLIEQEKSIMLTTVSGFEVQLALTLGFQPSNIILNGNGKCDWEIQLAIKNGIFINVDSLFDLKQIIQIAERQLLISIEKPYKPIRLLIRVNPSIDPKVHAYNSTGLKTSKFGTSLNQLDLLYETIKDNENIVQLFGFHCHLGSTISDVQVVADCVTALIDVVEDARVRKEFKNIRYLNIGGGLNIDYLKYAQRTSKNELLHTTTPTPSEYIRCFKSLATKLTGIEIIVEPGRWLVANTCILVTSVLGYKQAPERKYIIVDAAMTECIRPALYQAYHHIDTLQPQQYVEHDRDLFDVVGPVCESGDFLGKDRYLPITLIRGQYLGIFDTGAYCATMSSNYNIRPRVAEYALDTDECVKQIRRRESLDDILKTYNLT
ncbi:unnamed protein product, partial [Didymodactylos carnosus]